MIKRVCVILFILSTLLSPCYGQLSNTMIPAFTADAASKFSSLALSCINQEYPNEISHVLHSDSDNKTPQQLHPAFYGCYNWHTSVSNYWMLVKILKTFPDIPEYKKIIETIDAKLTPANIAREIEYIQHEGRSGFGRPYGWAWLLKLTSELANSENEHEKRWMNTLHPLSETIKQRYYDYLPLLYYPVRSGNYENTAFAIAFALDYAIAMGDVTFEAFLKERARFYYLNDNNIPAHWEPEGSDFLSPSLTIADLMRRVLPEQDFVRWFKNFLPQIPFQLITPAVVTGRNSIKGNNLDGLNLSRAWCMFFLAKELPQNSKPHRELWQAGYRHAAEALPNVISDNYTHIHWLSAFAVYMYTSLYDIDLDK